MDDTDELAPAVGSILRAARNRSGGDDRVTVDPRTFTNALTAAEANGLVPVVAEIKPTSPTTDDVRTDDPVELAEKMIDGGAAALSVLTEPDHFGGSPEILRRVREAVDVPVLRKDFVVSEGQLDTVAADLILLIARFLENDDPDNLETMIEAARSRGFQALVEVHSRTELERALAAGADIVGINNRDLATLDVDMNTFERVASDAPDNVTLVAESGISSPADVHHMKRAGADALLIGSAIMAGDVFERTAKLTGAKAGEV